MPAYATKAQSRRFQFRRALRWKENRMPTYVCTAAVGRLTLDPKKEIVRSITPIRHEEIGAPRYLVQMVFYDVAPDSHYVAGRPAPANQIWVRGDIRGRRTSEQKSQMLRRVCGTSPGPAAPSRTRSGSTCRKFPPETSPNRAASCCAPGRRTHGSRRHPARCGNGSGSWPDKL